ncbi:hypothetical protein RF11_04707 [Thelohanellus kitauei]|uniref:Uncharacterized protein n=1 Tax=Thelohanellus kitauei TaxID=669202 RepID=A0A0C2NAB8_THEKT|nr:hypothetical protein RF11_04707 [Thelohanellus kitauei]
MSQTTRLEFQVGYWNITVDFQAEFKGSFTYTKDERTELYDLFSDKMSWGDITVAADYISVTGRDLSDSRVDGDTLTFTLFYVDKAEEGFQISDIELLFHSESGKRTLEGRSTLGILIEPTGFSKKDLSYYIRKEEAGGLTEISISLPTIDATFTH